MMLTARKARSRLFPSVVLTAVASCVNAQSVISARIEGQPLVYVKEGIVQGCGIRLFAVTPSPAGPWQSFDVSVNAWKSGLAVVNARSSDVDPADVRTDTPSQSFPVQAAWVKAAKIPATVSIDPKPAAGEDGNSLLYSTDIDLVLRWFLAPLGGESILVGIRRRGEGERIYSGVVQMQDSERAQLVQCLKEAFL